LPAIETPTCINTVSAISEQAQALTRSARRASNEPPGSLLTVGAGLYIVRLTMSLAASSKRRCCCSMSQGRAEIGEGAAQCFILCL